MDSLGIGTICAPHRSLKHKMFSSFDEGVCTDEVGRGLGA